MFATGESGIRQVGRIIIEILNRPSHKIIKIFKSSILISLPVEKKYCNVSFYPGIKMQFKHSKYFSIIILISGSKNA